jgi:hypothetical protein
MGMKVGDLVKWCSSHPGGPTRYCLITSVGGRYVTLTGFPQNQVFTRPDDLRGVDHGYSPLELISESR